MSKFIETTTRGRTLKQNNIKAVCGARTISQQNTHLKTGQKITDGRTFGQQNQPVPPKKK